MMNANRTLRSKFARAETEVSNHSYSELCIKSCYFDTLKVQDRRTREVASNLTEEMRESHD